MKQYEYRSVYIGVVGSEDENGECRDSIDRIKRQAMDFGPLYIRGTKGYEARQAHINNFMARPEYDGILLLDQDQIFPGNTLERLRAHKLPYVTGYYMRRRYQPILPVWYKLGPRGQWPMTPLTQDPEPGKLIPLGASGWGCVLIHREVITAVRELLKGEPECIEDDMDLWPYDLARVMSAIRGLQALVDEKPSEVTAWPALEAHTRTLVEEVRPLRVLKDSVGSDLRFPFYAREAGFTLMGDPDLRLGHMLNYPLHPDDYSALPDEQRGELRTRVQREVDQERRQIASLRKGLA
jgi:hypothetical protein